MKVAVLLRHERALCCGPTLHSLIDAIQPHDALSPALGRRFRVEWHDASVRLRTSRLPYGHCYGENGGGSNDLRPDRESLAPPLD